MTATSDQPREQLAPASALRSAARLLLESHDGATVVRQVLSILIAAVRADAYAAWRYDAARAAWSIIAAHGLPETYLQSSIPTTTITSLQPEPIVISDVGSAKLVEHRRKLYDAEGIRSLLVVPLTLHGDVTATLTCYYKTPRTFTSDEVEHVAAFADLASVAITTAELRQEREHHTHALERLNEVSRTISAELDLQRLIQSVTDAATELSGAQFGAFFYNVVDAAGESYMLYTISGVPREHFEKFPMPRNTDVFAPTFSGDGTVLSANIRKDPRYGHSAPHFGQPKGHLPVVSYLAVPVVSRSGEVLGGLFFGHEREGVFTESGARIVESLAASAAIAMDNVRLNEQRRLSEEHLRFLARASELFASSLDYETTLTNLTRAAVPSLADWCTVDIASADDPLGYRRLAIAHVDPAKIDLAWEIQRRYPPNPATDLIGTVLRTNEPQVITHLSDEMLRRLTRDEQHYELVRAVGIFSLMVVPLRGRRSALGAIAFVSSNPKRLFTKTDLEHTEEFARRAATAIENAMLYREAQDANRAKDDFLATLSHELRTPMTAILGWSSLLKEGGLDSETARSGIESILASAQAQATLIDDVLDVSRINAGKLRIEPSPVDLASVVQASVNTVQPAADAKGVTISIERRPGSMLVTGDANRLQQIIWNLLSNAIKFTPKDGSVVVRTEQAAAAVRVTVRDTGKGIAPDFLPHVFEPFRQAENVTTRVHGGLGLGLAIVKYLTELHGGSISAQSEGEGRGATFVVELPVRATTPAVLPKPRRQASLVMMSEGRTYPQLAGTRVLFVDDQEDARNLVSTVLERCGAEVVVAESVAEATSFVERDEFDALISDIAMPEEDGFELIRRVRDRLHLNTPAIAMTAFAASGDQERILAAGFNAFLKKPVEPFELASAVRDLLARRL